MHMANRLMLSLVLFLSLVSCNSQTNSDTEQLKEKLKMGWRPNPYTPAEELRIMNDTAVNLLTQLHVDTNISPEEYAEIQEKARKILEKIIRKDPKYGLPYSNLAALYLERKDTTKALEMMSLRTKVESDVAEAWQAMGFYKDLSGDSAAAYKDYETALALFDQRLAMGKRYAVAEDVAYYYDNWAGRAYTMLLMGKTEAGHDEIRSLLEEVAPIMGANAEVYAVLLDQDRASLLGQMQNEEESLEEE
jgi:tetratricopeptide (TPR) repeat protein